MKTYITSLKQRYRAFEERTLATLPPDQREDIRNFESVWNQHGWRNYAICIGIWLVVAALLQTTSSATTWLEAIVLSFLITGGICFALLSAWFGHHKYKIGVKWIVIIVLITLAGALVGGLLGAYMKAGVGGLADRLILIGPKIVWGGLIAGAIYALLLTGVVQVRRKQLEIRNMQLEQQAKQERLARQLVDAKLKLMQAQVEPHFLFNTLASVQQLAEGHAPEAARLTRDLIVFLRAGLTGLREESTTLAREFEMAAAYLSIMQTRMGERLSFSLDLPAVLATQSIPPAMLISLVENAIKHGIEPATDGGEIHFFARKEGRDLLIGVADTGLGLATTSTDSGVGLTNIRERLAAIYGDDAWLTITQHAPRGVLATITIKQTLETTI